jgi:hypothetical protein
VYREHIKDIWNDDKHFLSHIVSNELCFWIEILGFDGDGENSAVKTGMGRRMK